MGRSALALAVETDELRERLRKTQSRIHMMTGGRSPGCYFPLSAVILSPLDMVRKENWKCVKERSDGIGMDE
jgi:hypothetical protein